MLRSNFGKKISIEKRELIVELKEQGYAMTAIAERTGVGLSTVYKIVKSNYKPRKTSAKTAEKQERLDRIAEIKNMVKMRKDRELAEMAQRRSAEIEELKTRFWYCV